MAAGELYHESAGTGDSAVLLHPGFAASRIWDPQWLSYAQRFRLIRCDLRSFGRSPIRSLPVINTRDFATTWREKTLVSGLAEKLSQLAVETLVMVGQLDMSFVRDQARTFR